MRIGARRLALAATGGALSLTLGLVVALVSDSVTSSGNSIETGVYIPASHDLRAAVIANDGIEVCSDDSQFTDEPLTAAIATPDGTPNYDLNTAGVGQGTMFCFKNVGTDSGRLAVTFTDAVETDQITLGVYTDPGPLVSILRSKFWVAAGTTSSSCQTTGEHAFTYWTANQVEVDADLAPGKTCAIQLGVGTFGATVTDAQKYDAQRHRLQWDVVYDLQDIPA